MKLRELQEHLLDVLRGAAECRLAVQPSGLELTRLLVLKLRFERLMRADPAYRAGFQADPEAVTAEFARYDADGPSFSYFPQDELAQYRQWAAAAPADPSPAESR